MKKAIDVSDNQGVINWSQVKAAGVEHAILRSVRRSGKTDKQFAANLAGCRAGGISTAVYKYTYATTPAQAREEAQQVAALLAAHNLTCRIWWDVEDMPVLVPLGKPQLTACIRAAQEVITAIGLPFGIYTGLAFYKAGYFDAAALACPYWIARYPSRRAMELGEEPAEKYKPGIGKQLWGWQYTSNGRVPGIGGPVDVSLMYAAVPGENSARAETAGTGLTAEPVEKAFYLSEVFGESVSAALASIGENGGFDRRREIAEANGVRGYSGTAAQNLKLLQLLQSGKLLKP